jgi:hypothetical protein
MKTGNVAAAAAKANGVDDASPAAGSSAAAVSDKNEKRELNQLTPLIDCRQGAAVTAHENRPL